MAGKNKLERAFRVYWDDSGGSARDLTGDLVPGTFTGGGVVFDEVEMTGVSNTIKNYLAGHASAPVSAQFYLNDTATTGAFTVLKATGGLVGTLTLEWGSSGAAPTTGDPTWAGEYVLITNGPVAQNGGKWVIPVTWQPAAGAAAPAWGVK